MESQQNAGGLYQHTGSAALMTLVSTDGLAARKR
jgi:hypothetical protein